MFRRKTQDHRLEIRKVREYGAVLAPAVAEMSTSHYTCCTQGPSCTMCNAVMADLWWCVYTTTPDNGLELAEKCIDICV
jgi:hypothetical protein